MSKRESTQKKLSRVRPPRVHLTYDVEIGDAIEQKELPFVVGVMGSFTGKSEQEQPKMKDRKFISIDRDNFDDVMRGMAPRVAFQVDNKLSNDGSRLGVDVTFSGIEDFSPDAVVQQVEPLRKLLEARNRLADLRNKMAGNDKLEDLLQEVLNSTEKLTALKQASTREEG